MYFLNHKKSHVSFRALFNAAPRCERFVGDSEIHCTTPIAQMIGEAALITENQVQALLELSGTLSTPRIGSLVCLT